MLKPLGDRLIVKSFPAEEKSVGGIIIPENAKEKPLRGEVIAIGDGITTGNGQFIKTTLKTGDQIIYGKFSGTEIEIDSETYLIMREGDVFGVFQD